MVYYDPNIQTVKNAVSCRILAASLSLILVFFFSLPITPVVWASENNPQPLTLNGAGVPVPVIAIPAEEEALSDSERKAEAAPAHPATTDFLQTENPLSRPDRSADDEEVQLIESNDYFSGTTGSWGQSYDDLWWLKRVRAEEAWEYSRGRGVTVAVIDTGLDTLHPDISQNLWSNEAELNGLPGFDDDGNGYVDDIHGWDFYNWDNDPRDDNGHGTHVSGIIGAAGRQTSSLAADLQSRRIGDGATADNVLGIAGVAPESKILPVKVLSSGGSGFISDVIDGIRYAADLGAQVINLSLGILKQYLPFSLKTSLEKAVAYALGKGSVVVAAAGNENSFASESYPAAIKDVIAVGATENYLDRRAWFSNYGMALDFVAPGADILSLKAGGTSFGLPSGNPDYVRASGTSMASPIAAGVVALLRSMNPLLRLQEVYDRFRRSAIDLSRRGFDSFYGHGLVDAFAALSLESAVQRNALHSGRLLSGIKINLNLPGRTPLRWGVLGGRAIAGPAPLPAPAASSHSVFGSFNSSWAPLYWNTSFRKKDRK